jgi:hypothetical protein
LRADSAREVFPGVALAEALFFTVERRGRARERDRGDSDLLDSFHKCPHRLHDHHFVDTE